MASISKQRKLLLEDPSSFSDEEIVQMVKTGVASLYEISKTGALGPYRKKRLEEMLSKREAVGAPNQEMTPPPFPGQSPGSRSTVVPQQASKPKFPVQRKEIRRPRHAPTPPPFPGSSSRPSGNGYNTRNGGNNGTGPMTPPSFGNTY